MRGESIEIVTVLLFEVSVACMAYNCSGIELTIERRNVTIFILVTSLVWCGKTGGNSQDVILCGRVSRQRGM